MGEKPSLRGTSKYKLGTADGLSVPAATTHTVRIGPREGAVRPQHAVTPRRSYLNEGTGITGGGSVSRWVRFANGGGPGLTVALIRNTTGFAITVAHPASVATTDADRGLTAMSE